MTFSLFQLFLWAGLFAVHGILLIAASWNHSFIPDEDAYLNLAMNLAVKGTYSLDFAAFWHMPSQPNTYYAPGWPFTLAIGYSIGGVTGCWIMLWLVWCVESVSAYRFGMVCGLPEKWRWVLIGWMTVYPIYVFYHGHLMTEPLVTCFVLSIIGLGLRFIRQPSVFGCIGLAVISAFGHLTRTQLLLPLVAVALVATATVPWRRLWPLSLMFILIHLAVVSPWLARMVSVGGTPWNVELKFGINLFTYCGATGGDGYQPDDSPVPYPPDLELLTPATRDTLLRRRAISAIISQPMAYAQTCLDRVGYLLSPTPNFYKAGLWQTVMLVGSTALFVYLPFAAVLVASLKGRHFNESSRLLLVAIVVWYAFHVAVHASIRQRIPSDILLAALSLLVWGKQPFRCEKISSGEPETVTTTD